MRWALFDGTQQIDATELREQDREDYRGRLSCLDQECSALMHWRNRSKDGKAATFFGRHAGGCEYGSKSDEQIELQRAVEEFNAIANTADALVIRLDSLPQNRPVTDEVPDATGTPGRTYRHQGADRQRGTGSVGYRPLLGKLVTDPDFRHNRRALTLSDRTRTTIADGCVHVDGFTLRDTTMILWGQVGNVRGNFLNTGYMGEKKPAVLLHKEAASAVKDSLNLTELSELNGWHFLVEGRFQESSNGGPYVSLDSARRIAFLPPQNSAS
ncbi:hypothetical protein ACTXPA_17535 [Glutamicibacter arilaitensis]|uniref:hypothetical protein n=1 Tax=Glutamicibacter arilaitensis TaxID=256701 RepID=UPI003FD34EB5